MILLTSIAVSTSSNLEKAVQKAEMRNLSQIKKKLIAAYAQHGSWRVAFKREKVWKQLVNPRPRRSLDLLPSKSQETVDSSYLDDHLKTGRRLSLYDVNKKVVVGRPSINQNQYTEAILYQGKVIGWMGLASSKSIEDSLPNLFLAQQYKTFYIIGACIFLIALVTAIMITRQLHKPITSIIAGTSRLIEGNYDHRFVKESNDEIGLLFDNFNELAAALHNSQKNRAQWVTNTSHELRTPLTILKTQLIAIHDGVLTCDRDRISLLIKEIDGLSKIVDDLYQLSHSHIGGLTYKKKKINPVEILKNAIDNRLTYIKERNLNIEYQEPKDLGCRDDCAILGDETRINQLFSNLLENSCKYTEKEGKIGVYADCVGADFMVRIEDSHPGVTPEQQSRLFDSFYQVNKDADNTNGGLGVGLTISKAIVAAHRGEISVRDSSLGGLCVEVKLPVFFNREAGK